MGMSRDELAEKTGLATETIARYERGEREPKANVVRKLASALGVSVSYLMGETSEERRGDSINNVHASNSVIGQTNAPITITDNSQALFSKEELELLRIYKELNVKNRMKLLMTAMDLESSEMQKSTKHME